MFFVKNLLFVVLTSTILVACSFDNRWVGIYYPDKNFPGRYELGPKFDSEYVCTQWGKMRANGKPNASYACGQGCKATDFGGYLCEKTLYEHFNQNPD